MANAQRPELSSVFDDMLTHSGRRFDDLYRGGRSYAGSLGAGSSVRLDPDLPSVRRLNERFGSDWRCEISEQRRDGDEAIVLCKLIFGKQGTVRAQLGRAKISGGSVTGLSGGMRFKVGRVVDAEQSERDAFRRATEAALINCVDLI
jgi:hypothetical protein